MKSPTAYLTLTLFPLLAHAQEFSFPESAAYDTKTASCFITNYSGNNVIRIDREGGKSIFIENIPSPLGAALEDGILYFVTGKQSVKGFRIEDSEEVFSVTLKEAKFLNDLTSDNSGTLYTTDSDTGMIFRINVAEPGYTLLTNTGFETLNGIIHDAERNRLVFCDFSPKGQIGQFNLGSNKMSLIPVCLGENLDGIAADDGSFYISCWGPGNWDKGFQPDGGVIYAISKDFSGDKRIVRKGLYGPADIFYVPSIHSLISPNALSNTVDLIEVRKPCGANP